MPRSPIWDLVSNLRQVGGEVAPNGTCYAFVDIPGGLERVDDSVDAQYASEDGPLPYSILYE